MRSPALVFASLLFGALALPAAAQREVASAIPAVPDRRELAQRWEEVLLLDAIRHLRLSHSQLQRMKPLIGLAERRSERLAERNRQTANSLTKLLSSHRSRLLKGAATPTTEQERALLLRKALLDEQVRAADEQVLSITPRFAPILLGEQASRAFRLAEGDWPKGIDRSPSLLHVESGFVLRSADRHVWREAALRQDLIGRHPAAVVRGLVSSRPSTESIARTLGATLTYSVLTDKVFRAVTSPLAETSSAPSEDPARKVQVDRAKAERGALDRDPERLASQWSALVEDKELPDFLRHLARRLFLSPRFSEVLAGRLGKPAEPFGRAREMTALEASWEDVLLLNALRYLQLSPEQLEKLLDLADDCEARLTELDTRLAPSNRRLWEETGRFREILLQGRPLPSREHQALLDFNKGVRDQRVQLDGQIARDIAPKLAGILDRSQLTRAYLLLQGAWPRNEAKSPLLLEPDSGFILEQSTRDDHRKRAIRKVLAATFPSDIVSEVAGRERGQLAEWMFLKQDRSFSVILQNELSSGVVESYGRLTTLPKVRAELRVPTARPRNADPLQAAVEREIAELNQRWEKLGDLLQDGATPFEREVSLRPLVRRLFLSPRFRPVVEERLGCPEPPSEEPSPAAAS